MVAWNREAELAKVRKLSPDAKAQEFARARLMAGMATGEKPGLGPSIGQTPVPPGVRPDAAGVYPYMAPQAQAMLGQGAAFNAVQPNRMESVTGVGAPAFQPRAAGPAGARAQQLGMAGAASMNPWKQNQWADTPAPDTYHPWQPGLADRIDPRASMLAPQPAPVPGVPGMAPQQLPMQGTGNLTMTGNIAPNATGYQPGPHVGSGVTGVTANSARAQQLAGIPNTSIPQPDARTQINYGNQTGIPLANAQSQQAGLQADTARSQALAGAAPALAQAEATLAQSNAAREKAISDHVVGAIQRGDANVLAQIFGSTSSPIEDAQAWGGLLAELPPDAPPEMRKALQDRYYMAVTGQKVPFGPADHAGLAYIMGLIRQAGKWALGRTPIPWAMGTGQQPAAPAPGR